MRFTVQHKHPEPHATCFICLDGILEPGGYPRRHWAEDGMLVFEWLEKPEQAILDALDAYLAAPACMPEHHAWWERKLLDEATQTYDKAKEHLDEMKARPKGWSIDG